MAEFRLEIVNAKNEIKRASCCEDFVDLVYTEEYEEGDSIRIVSSEYPIFLNLQVDEVLGESFVYVTGDVCYQIPFGVAKLNRSPKAFIGNCHYLYVKKAPEFQVHAYKNLALNPNDQHMTVSCYPHAIANTETRGEAVFAAQNVIDGMWANKFHGEWPYSSWGINRQSDAELTVEFGRTVKTDKIVLYIRADFPHDNWWKQVTLSFSDGSFFDCPLDKTGIGQEISFPEKKIEWVKIHQLIQSEEPSPFPALTQLEIYGVDL